MPGEARTWWGWHDGAYLGPSAPSRERTMAAGFSFLSLSEGIELARQYRQLAVDAAGARAKPMWRPTWLPFGSNAHGGLAAFDCACPDRYATPVHAIDYTSMGENVLQPQAATLGVLVTWWLDAFDNGVYRLDPGTGVLASDAARLRGSAT